LGPGRTGGGWRRALIFGISTVFFGDCAVVVSTVVAG
jgi:hypothetical protein